MCAHLAARCRINAETGLPTLPMRGPRQRSSGRATTIVLRVWFSRNVLREFLWIMIWDTAHLIALRRRAIRRVGCLLVAQSGYGETSAVCPLSGGSGHQANDLRAIAGGNRPGSPLALIPQVEADADGEGHAEARASVDMGAPVLVMIGVFIHGIATVGTMCAHGEHEDQRGAAGTSALAPLLHQSERRSTESLDFDRRKAL